MVISIAIGAIVLAVAAAMIGTPVDAYMTQSRISQVVDAADVLTHRVSSDVLAAVPNTIRVRNTGNIRVLQMLVADAVLFYMDQTTVPAPAATDGLDFTVTDAQFTLYGGIPALTNGEYLVVDNTGLDNQHNVYSAATLNMIPASQVSSVTPATPPTGDHLSLSPGKKFVSSPLSHKIYIASPVTYICNRTTKILTRFARHAIATTLPVNEASAELHSVGSTIEQVATGVESCDIPCISKPGVIAGLCVAAKLGVNLSRGTAPKTVTIQVLQLMGTELTP
jgi:MSHA biogenesis protein MshO